MSHPELVFPVDEAAEALQLMGCDGLLHPEETPSGHATPASDRHHYCVDPALTAWAGRLHS